MDCVLMLAHDIKHVVDVRYMREQNSGGRLVKKPLILTYPSFHL
jgi:hypothetical protein